MKGSIKNLLALLLTMISIGANSQILLPKFEVPVLLDSLSSDAEESMPLPYDRGDKIYFVRTYIDADLKQRSQGQEVWSSERVEGKWKSPENLFDEVNDRGNNAVIGTSKDGKRVYVFNSIMTRRKLAKGLAYIDQDEEGEWGKLKKMEVEGFRIGEGYYSFYVNHDESIMMISMAPNEKTIDEDLYVSLKQDDGSWGEVIHLGDKINTTNYEISPYLAEDKKTLYFSSNGHGGYGSADVFVSYRLDDSWSNWTEPVNMGEPINSIGFDAYFIIANQEEVYFSSNRNGKYSDLFTSEITRQLAYNEDGIFDEEEKEDSEKKSSTNVSGQLYLKGLPAENVKLEVIDEEGDVVDEVVTDSTGNFNYSKLDPDKVYAVKIAEEDEVAFGESKMYMLDDTGKRMSRLERNEQGNFAERTDVFNKEVFQGVYKYKELPVAKATLVVIDENGFPMDTITTDDDGSFNYEGAELGDDFLVLPIETKDKDIEQIDLYLSDNQGEKLRTLPINSQVLASRPMTEITKEEDREPIVVRSQFTYEGLPVENVKLEIYDDQGVLVDEVVTDAMGMFSYKKLDPEKVYVVKIKEEDLDEYADGNIYQLDDEGEKTNKFVHKEIGNFAEKGESNDKELKQGVYSYNKLPVAEAALVVVDESGFPMDTVFTDDEGRFNYEALNSEEKFSVIPLETDDKEIDKIDLYLSDNKGNKVERLPLTEEIIAMRPTRQLPSSESTEPEPITVNSQFTLKGLPVENVKLEIYDEKGELVDEVVTDAYGRFSYNKLDPDKNYVVKIAEEDLTDFSGGKVYFIDKEGNKTGRYVVDKEDSYLESGTISHIEVMKGVYNYEGQPIAKAALGIMDESGFILDTVYTDDEGNFEYREIDKREDYSVVVMDAENLEEDKLSFYLVDEKGDQIESTAKQGLMVRKPVVSLLDKTVIYSQLTLKGLPVDNVKLEIYDDEGVLVDEVVTDSYGMFSYEKLDPDKNYVVKIAEEDIEDFSGSRVYFVDDDGKKTGRYSKDKENTFKEKGEENQNKETVKGYYSYKNNAVRNVALGIFDESGFLLDTIYTEEDGSFKYGRLDSNEAFSIVVMNSDLINREELNIELTDEKGDRIKSEPIQQGLMVRKPIVSIVDKSVVSGQFVYQGLPVENVKLEIYDEDGTFIDEVVTDSYGTFTYKKLDPDKNYMIKIPESDEDQFASGKLYFTDDEGNKIGRYTETKKGEFVERDDSAKKEKLQGEFTYDNEPVKNVGLIILDENGVPIDTFYTDQDGHFEFFMIDSDEEFTILPMNVDDVKLDKIDLYLTDNAGDRIKTLIVEKPEVAVLQSKEEGASKRKSETRNEEEYAKTDPNNFYIYFKFNQYILSDKDKRMLDLVIDVLTSYEEATVNLIGHTDNIGSEEVNFRFGESRARSARRYLTNNGIENHRITIESKGETKPIASNESEEGRAKNRRVEVVLN